MKYTEAFKTLGYELNSPRQDWSAGSNSGICITLWRSELKVLNKLPWLVTGLHCGPHADWHGKAGNRERTSHLQRAMNEFGGRVDVVIVHGEPGVSYGDADPWVEAERGGHWQVSDFDPATAHFTALVVPVA